MINKTKHIKSKSTYVDREEKNASIEALIEVAMKGDGEALHSLCEKMANGILFRVKYLLGNEMDAEDVSQNVLIRMYENIHSLHNSKSFMAWLGGIIVNETRRYASKHSRNKGVVNIEDHMGELAEEDPELVASENRCDDRLHKAIMRIIESLPHRQREAVLLHYYNDLNISEVATEMKIPHQCVSNYLELARKRLKIELDKLPYAT